MTCSGCGGIVGRDCFNPQECEQITRAMAADARAADYRRAEAEHLEAEYHRAQLAEHEVELMHAGAGLA